MTIFYMLVGLPGTGKSTWTDRFKRKHRDELINEGIKNDTPYNWNDEYDQVLSTTNDNRRF